MSKYTTVTIFTKKGNLLPYLRLSHEPMFEPTSDRAREYYGKEREIELVLATRYERKASGRGSKLMCKISCPVNPLPIKGEFETPSYRAICDFLYSHGWTKKETISQHWFE